MIREDLVLLVRSSDGRHWVLPKGHIETGERPEDCAVREVREEAGVVCEPVEELGVDAYSLARRKRGTREVRALYFLMHYLGEAPADEDRPLRWTPWAEAAVMIEFPGSRALVEEAARRLGRRP